MTQPTIDLSPQAAARGPLSLAGRRLRMGIMCTGSVFDAWQAECVRGVLALGFVEAALLITDADSGAAPSPSPLARLGRALVGRRTGWNLFQRAFVRGRSRASVPVDLGTELENAPRLVCTAPKRGTWARHFTAEEVARIKAYDLDFILRFAFNIVKGEIHGAAHLGVWSFHHDDLDRYRGRPACFWPMYFGDPVQGVTLQRLTDGIDNGIVLAQAWYQTHPHSYVRNRDAAFFASAGLVAKVCRELHAGAGSQAWAGPSLTTAPVRTTPKNLQVMVFCVRLAWRKSTQALATLFRHGVWNVALVDAPIQTFLGLKEAPAARWLPRPAGASRGGIMADPFGMAGEDGLTLMCEQTDTPEGRGRIVTLEWRDDGRISPPRTVLEAAHHLSYPYLFNDQGQTYCVPETGEAREIRLLQAVDFPGGWTQVATLVQGIAALDSTLFRFEDRWWLLAATKATPDKGGALELHAWYAAELRGPYTPHPANPIKTDIRSTRPAGTPFLHAGYHYRPAQDCSMTYGGALALCRIDRLTPAEFKETVVQLVRPNRRDGYRFGLHTLSACGTRTLIDGKRMTLLPSELMRRIRAKLRRGRSSPPATPPRHPLA